MYESLIIIQVAIILLFSEHRSSFHSFGSVIDPRTVYGSYLFFQLKSHANLYDDHNASNVFASTNYPARTDDGKSSAIRRGLSKLHIGRRTPVSTDENEDVAMQPIDSEIAASHSHDEEEEEEETPQMSVVMTVALLAVVTVVSSLLLFHQKHC